MCSIDIFSSGTNPNPLPPTIEPDFISQFLPIIELDMTQLFPINEFSPIFTPLPIITLFSIIVHFRDLTIFGYSYIITNFYII